VGNLVDGKNGKEIAVCIADESCSLLDQYAGSRASLPVLETPAGNVNFYIRLKQQKTFACSKIVNRHCSIKHKAFK